MILIDTNVVSEVMHPKGSQTVRAWLESRQHDAVLSVVTLQEIAFGAHRLPDPERRERILSGAQDVTTALSGRVLAIDERVALRAGALLAARQTAGIPMSPADGQIAATCMVHECELATRNTKDFEGLRIELVNPWETALA